MILKCFRGIVRGLYKGEDLSVGMLGKPCFCSDVGRNIDAVFPDLGYCAL